MLCPCSARTLIEAVAISLRGITDESNELQRTIEDTLESIIANGDLFEASAQNSCRSGQKSVLYLVPPAYVRRSSGALLLLGVLPDGINPLPNDLSATVEYVNHLRILPAASDDNLLDTLVGLGYFEIKAESWLRTPEPESASSYLHKFNVLLEAVPEAVRFPGLQVLDPQRPVRYYPDRWVDAAGQTGRFVGRRPQAYGSPIWCYVQIRDELVRLIDFPSRNSPWRGCDEALSLQAAIDHERGHPQVYGIRPGPRNSEVLRLFSPIPMWARRRLESIGEPVSATGCLMSYKFRSDEVAEEQRFLSEYLWLVQEH
jgi:hypothetical protein